VIEKSTVRPSAVTLVSAGPSVEDKHFPCVADLLRWLAAEHGRHFSSRPANVKVHELYLGRRGTDGRFFAIHVPSFRWRTYGSDALDRADRLLRRYEGYRHYLTEVWPQWRTVETIPWMDNSVDEVQVDRFGNRRTVQTVAPHGDACF
jgi:hypothetical protein